MGDESEADVFGWDDLYATARPSGRRAQLHRPQQSRRDEGRDEAFFYHSNDQKAVVGIMRVSREGKPDGEDGKWVSVEVKP